MQTTQVIPLPLQVFIYPPFLYVVSQDISVLELETGKYVRKYSFEGETSPTLAADTLYVNVNNGYHHAVQAVRLLDGNLLWSYKTEEQLTSAPVVADGQIYISKAEGKIDVLRASDGTLCWQVLIEPDQRIPSFLAPILFTSPLVSDGIVYVAPAVNSPLTPFVYAYQAGDGALLWKARVDVSPSWSGLTKKSDVLYLCTASVCLALQASNGSLLWKYQAPGQILSSPVIADSSIYIVFAQHKHGEQKTERTFCALRCNDGSVLWQKPSEERSLDGRSHFMIAASTLYQSSGAGYLTALQARDGVLLWRVHVGGTSLSLPDATDESVYVGASDGFVYCFRAVDGTFCWKTFVGTVLTGTVLVQARGS